MRHLIVCFLGLALAVTSAPSLAQDIPDSGTDDGGDDADPGFPPPCPPGRVSCHTAEVDWLYRDALFDDIDFDTGWIPADSPIQMRFGIALGGSTEVGLGGTVVTSWPPSLEVMVPGREGTGYLRANYGLEIIARLRIDVEVVGIPFDWEGDLPIPFIPEDLRLAGEVVFDPFALPGADPRPVWVTDSTDRVRVLWYDITDMIVDIPGISGGFLLAVQGDLDTGYQTDRIDVANALPIVGHDERTLLEPPPPEDPDDEGGYGASAEVVVHPEGALFYDGTILLLPELYFEILGTRFDYTIVEIPLDLVDLDSEVIFDDEVVDVHLPDVDVQPARLDFGWGYLGEMSAQPIVFVNNGHASLVVEAVTRDGAFFPELTRLVLEPHSTERLSMRFRPQEEGDLSVMFEFATNDPDEPSVVVLLEGEGRLQPTVDAGPVDADLDSASLDDADLGLDGDVEQNEELANRGCDCGVAAPRPTFLKTLLSIF